MMGKIPSETWTKDYADAGHDVESLFTQPFCCKRCGGTQIDLSEDLAYGQMSRCKSERDE